MAQTSAFDPVTQDDIRDLIATRSAPAVSIYQPSHRAGPEAEQNILRYKNLLSDAEAKLAQHGLSNSVKGGILRPARALLDRTEFWRHQLDGLAVFTAPEFFRVLKLPHEAEELVVVGDSPHVTPLLPAMTQGYFYILAVSMESLRLLRATRHGIEEIDVHDVPKSLGEATRYDDYQKKNLQRHPTSRAGVGGRTMQHGHGPGDEDLKEEIRRYFQAVDAGVCRLLNLDGAPLVVAAVDYMITMYRHVSGYKNVVGTGIEGSPDQLTPRQLLERARPIVDPIFREPVVRAGDKYGRMSGTGLASCELGEVLRGAHVGRIESLLVPKGERRWGVYLADTDTVETRDEPVPADIDLLDLATRQVLLHGGSVYLVERDEMPCTGPMAAVFRY
jgi:Bacterial archaeo-eukaryotic release factor family 7